MKFEALAFDPEKWSTRRTRVRTHKVITNCFERDDAFRKNYPKTKRAIEM